MNHKAYDKLMKSYHKKYGDFVLGYHPHMKARWIYSNYNSEKYKEICYNDIRPNHRYIFPDEVVIDIDTDNQERIELTKNHIVGRLKEMDKSYTLWKQPSGKYHIHIFFEDLNINIPTYRRKMIKEYLLYHIIGRLYISMGKIDKQLIGKHLIRAEYGLYEKNLLYKHYKELKEEFIGKNNKVPMKVYNEINKKLIEDEGNYKEYKEKFSSVYGNGDTPECIKTLLSEDFKSLGDGRDRALFILGYWFKKSSKTQEEWVDKLKKFNAYNLNNYLNKFDLQAKINYRMRTNRNFSHKYVHELLDELKIRHECKVNSQEIL